MKVQIINFVTINFDLTINLFTHVRRKTTTRSHVIHLLDNSTLQKLSVDQQHSNNEVKQEPKRNREQKQQQWRVGAAGGGCRLPLDGQIDPPRSLPLRCRQRHLHLSRRPPRIRSLPYSLSYYVFFFVKHFENEIIK